MIPLATDRLRSLSAAVENAPDPVCLYRLVPGDGSMRAELVYANRAIEGLTGLSPDTAVACDLSLLDNEALRGVLGIGWTAATTQVAHPDGGTREVEVTAWVDPETASERYLTCIARDTTAQRDLEESLLDLSTALESSADMILISERPVVDEPWRIVYANAAFLEQTGYSADETKGLSLNELVTHADPATVERARQEALLGDEARMDIKLTRKDGSWFWSSWNGRSIVHAEPSLRRRVVTIRNIHERVLAERRLEEHSVQLRRLHVVAASSGQSADSQIDAILKFGTEAFGLESAYTGSIADGTFTWEHLICENEAASPILAVGNSLPLEHMALREAIRSGDVIAHQDLASSGKLGPAREHFDPNWRSYIAAPLVVRGKLYGGMGFISHKLRRKPFDSDELDLMRLIAALVGSATERGIQERRLDALAFYDGLTGLPNRVLLEDRLQQLLAASKRTGRRFALHALDLDFFKEINDTAGHAAGDEALRIITTRFVGALRESDTLARTGGDEFIVLQPGVEGEGDAERLAQRLIDVLADPLIVEQKHYHVGVSIGISISERDGNDASHLLRSADRALYVAKGAGRARYAFSKAAE